MTPEPLAYSNGHHSLVVQALYGDLLARGISLDIHAADEMLGFFLHSQGRDLEQAIGSFPVLRIPRGLASFQDLYVVVKESGAGAADLFSSLRIEREADGFLEHCSLDGSRRNLRLSGWIADRVTGRPPKEVRIRIDGQDAISCRDLTPRPDVAGTFAADPVDVVEWRAALELPRGAAAAESSRLAVYAVSQSDEELHLCSGSIAEACIRSAQLDTAILQRRLAQKDTDHQREIERREAAHADELAGRQERIEALARRIQAMEASRFWKARNLWFGFKRAVGLTTER